jgi:hypothetical protein
VAHAISPGDAAEIASQTMTWPEQFMEVFREIASPLAKILNAHGCREGWVHGEFYRRLWTPENGFKVNCSCSQSRVKHDLYSRLPTEMIAEMKIVTLTSSHPNITRAMKSISPSPDPLPMSTLRSLSQPPGSYFNDVLRLHEQSERFPAIERYMILVMERPECHTADFGPRLLVIHFSPHDQEHEFRCDDFLVRITQL